MSFGAAAAGTTMQLVRRCPPAPLAAFVDYIWHLSDAPAHARERILPNGTLELVFNLAGDEVRIYDDAVGEPRQRLSGAVVSGVFSRFFVIDTREHGSMLGVHFKPGGAFPFLRRVPVPQLADSHLDLATAWGDKALWLRERLAAAPTIDERFEQMEAALLEELGEAAPAHRAIAPTIRALSAGSTAISTLASRANITHRSLIELFRARVGTTPKLFQRMQRLQSALSLTRASAAAAASGSAVSSGPTCARVAQLAGYCDQSHWIRECVALAGLTPAQYSSQWSAHVKGDHVPLLASPASAAAVER